MLARCLSYLNEIPDPALLVVPGLGRIYTNSAGGALVAARNREARALGVARSVAATGEVATASFDGVDLAFAPLFDEVRQVELVIALSRPLHALPRILNDLQEPARGLARVVHVFPAIVITARPSGAIDFLNERWYEVTGRKRTGASPAESFRSGVAPASWVQASARWDDGVRDGEPFAFELQVATAQGERRWFELRAEPLRSGEQVIKWIAALHDVDDNVRARELLRRSERRLRLMAEITRAIGDAVNAKAVARAVVATGGDDVSWLVAFDDRAGGVRAVRPLLDEALLPVIADFFGGHTADVVRVLPDERVAVAVALSAGATGWIGVVTGGELADVRSEWLPVVREVALRAGTVLERLQAFERERLVVETLQRSMLPVAMPTTAAVTFDVAYAAAARERLVGGDWYDAFDFGDGRIGIAIGDVAGHGLEASIIMGQLRQVMRAASREDRSPAHVLASANDALIAESSSIASAFYGVLDTVTMRLTYASAGHPPPLVVGRDGGVRELVAEGVILGALPQGHVRTFEAAIAPGSALVLYTDGVVEANRDAEAGERQLAGVLAGWGRSGFAWTAAQVQAAVIGADVQVDDAAMLVLRFPVLDRLIFELPATRENAHRLRRAVARFFTAQGGDEERAFDATLAVAEAVNNTVLHAYPDGSGDVRLGVRRVRQGIVATVEDAGHWPDGTRVQAGHGLDIIAQLAPAVQIRRGPRGSKVSFRINVPVAVEA